MWPVYRIIFGICILLCIKQGVEMLLLKQNRVIGENLKRASRAEHAVRSAQGRPIAVSGEAAMRRSLEKCVGCGLCEKLCRPVRTRFLSGVHNYEKHWSMTISGYGPSFILLGFFNIFVAWLWMIRIFCACFYRFVFGRNRWFVSLPRPRPIVYAAGKKAL